MNRRKLIGSIPLVLAAPAIVRAQTLMELGSGSVAKVVVAGGGVVVDAVGSELHSGSATTKDYTGITIGAGSHRALIAIIQFDINPVGALEPGPIISVTWDQGGTNQAMSNIITQVSGGTPVTFQALYGLINPASGNKTLRVTWTNSAGTFLSSISFTGVNQTGGATSFPNSTSSGTITASATIPVTSATGNKVVGAEAPSAGVFTLTGTTIFNDGASGVNINAGANYDNGAATVNIGVISGNTYIAATDVKAG